MLTAVPCLIQDAYQAYEQHFKDSPPAVLRDCLELKSGLDPISIDEVCDLCLSVLSACTMPDACSGPVDELAS